VGDNRKPNILIELREEDDIVEARKQARELAKQVGFGLVDQSRIATAVSELARNVIRYATNGRGNVAIFRVESARGTGIEIVVSDEGPGIADVNQAMREGYTTGHGMGLGLSGTRRLMDEMDIDSALGRGTTVTIRKMRR
jgi:serine/threonine-protein kinase RsbT